ncbi:hypothetical protein MTO96_043675 [Rhipicephalus appendiculatus]
MEDHEMALLNEPDVTTRRGNSAARDTTPDLTRSSGTLDVTWGNEDVDLGSDHSVIGITIRGSRYRAPDIGADHGLGQDEKVYPRTRKGVRGRIGTS